MNELNGEMELLQEQIQQIHTGIEQFQSQGVEMEEKRRAILRDLEERYPERVRERTGSYTR